MRLWDLRRGRAIAVLELSPDWGRSVAFSPDGHRLAASFDDGRIHLVDALTGEVLLTRDASPSWVGSVAFSPDGGRLASAGGDQVLRLWETDRLEPVAQVKLGGPISNVHWGPRGITVSIGRDVVHVDMVSASETSHSRVRAAGS
jgi:WD40 repeat protein